MDRRSKGTLISCAAFAVAVMLYTGVVSDARSTVGADYFIAVASLLPVVLVAFVVEHVAMLSLASRMLRPMEAEYEKVAAEFASRPEAERPSDVVAAIASAGVQLKDQTNRFREALLETGQELVTAFTLFAAGEVLALYALADERYTVLLLIATAGFVVGLGYLLAWTLNARGMMVGVDAHIALGDISDDVEPSSSRFTRRPDRLSGGPLTHVEIEAQLRSAYEPKLEICERLNAFGEDALHAWQGRAIDPESVDPIILAEGARATKTYGATVRLLASGFGPQASMLNRALFEGMAIAHWAHANPHRAVELFKKHGRHSELLWGDAFEKADPADARVIDAGSEEERTELGGLFGTYGTKLWTGHRSLYDLLPEIEDQWPEGSAREQLWWFFRVAHRDNTQVLHSTALGLSAGVARTADALLLDAGPSDSYLDRGMLGGLWSYEQTLTLLWDHFAVPGREALDELIKEVQETFDA